MCREPRPTTKTNIASGAKDALRIYLPTQSIIGFGTSGKERDHYRISKAEAQLSAGVLL